IDCLVCRVNPPLCLHTSLTSPYDPGKSQDRKLTAAIAMPMPKTIPANMRLLPPSPKANIKPPTTIATRLRPLAIGPVKAFCSCCTAFSQGLPPDCSKMSVSIVFILDILKPAFLLRVRYSDAAELDRVLHGRRKCGFLERYGKRLKIWKGRWKRIGRYR